MKKYTELFLVFITIFTMLTGCTVPEELTHSIVQTIKENTNVVFEKDDDVEDEDDDFEEDDFEDEADIEDDEDAVTEEEPEKQEEDTETTVPDKAAKAVTPDKAAQDTLKKNDTQVVLPDKAADNEIVLDYGSELDINMPEETYDQDLYIDWYNLAALEQPQPESSNAYVEGYQPGMVFPDFTMTDTYGNPVNLSDYRGRVLYLNFFTTWYPYCFYEIPDMESIAVNYGSDVAVVLVDIAENAELAREYAETYGITLPINNYPEWQVGTHTIKGVPESFVIDRNGVIVDYIMGKADYNWMDAAVSAAVRAY